MKSQFQLFLFLIPILSIIGCSSSSDEDNQPQLATLQTVTISDVTTVSATSGGSISSDGNSPITEKGVCWNTSPNPTITNSHTSDGTGSASFVSNLTSLLGNTTYYVRAYATNAIGTSYGNEVSFTSNAIVIPTITTTVASNVKQVTADSGGNITSDGGSAVSSRGICWNTTGNPTILDPKTLAGTGSGTFSATAINIAPNTTYYLRAFATNTAGTAYGTQITFTTQNLSLPGNGMTDNDGNTYQTVILGGQEWMVQNLRSTKYRNGDSLTNITTNTAWQNNNPGTGIWCHYNNLSSYDSTYGKLYDWYAVTDQRNIAPAGWHVPTQGEWTTLVNYLGGSSQAGGALKQTGTSNWTTPNAGASNISGFTALPGGFRKGNNGTFQQQAAYGCWWTSELGNGVYGVTVNVNYNDTTVTLNSNINNERKAGVSIRLIKD